VATRAEILSRPTRSSRDEARSVAEIAVPLLALCLATASQVPGCSEPTGAVLGGLLIWTPSLILFGELVLRANRRARYRKAVLAEERRRIMRSMFGDASPPSERLPPAIGASAPPPVCGGG
jgi:hypothetical protein